jgi:hypothetical protein
MDRRERFDSDIVALRAFLRGWEADIWTALPAIVESYDATKLTVSAQPTIKSKYRGVNAQTYADVQLPLCVDVPVDFPGGGGWLLTFPLQQGDEGILIFASRCIDSWWQNGGVQPQAEMRMHDLSDGMFIPGLRSQKRLPAGAVSTTSAQLRSDDGQTYIELASGGAVNIVAPGGVTITGSLNVTGTIISGFGGADQVGLQTHEHPGNNTPPTPGT